MNHPYDTDINESNNVKPGSFAAINSPGVVGKIVHITSSGLLFQYTNLNEGKNVHVRDGSMILGGNGIYVRELKFNVVEEVPIQVHELSQLDVRQVKVRFGELTQEQSVAVENYIRLNSGGHPSGMWEEIDTP